MRVVRRRNAGIERDEQAHLADLFGCAAVVERAVDVHLELGGAIDRGVHGDDDQAAHLALEAGTRPDVAVGVGVDQVLQRRAEFAERAHALLDRLGSEDLLADGDAAAIEFLRVHAGFSSSGGSMIRAGIRLLAASLVFAASLAYAQSYPTHTVKLVVPYGPGSSPDSVGRIVAQEMQQALGQDRKSVV